MEKNGKQHAWDIPSRRTLDLLVVRRRAGAALLDTYEQERVPIAQRLLETTDRAFQAVVSNGWLPRLLRTKVIARVAATAMKLAPVRRFAFRTISQIGIRYPESTISQTLTEMPKGAPAAGDRFPWVQLSLQASEPAGDLYQKLDDTRFNLLVFGQGAPDVFPPPDYADVLRVHVIPSGPHNDAELTRRQIPAPSFYLLRPDGHVGLCGIRLDAAAIRRYLAEKLHLDHDAQADAA